MVWIPGATFTMGSDRHYPEEAPAHPQTVSGFWIEPRPVTNREFGRFVRKTGHVTMAEQPPDPADYPGARPEMLVPFSAVFVAPRHRVSLADPHDWWTAVPGANWRQPQGPGSSIRNKPDHPVVHLAWADAMAYASWAGREIPTEAEWELAACGGLDGAEFAWGDELTPDGRWMANTWQGEFPVHNTEEDGYQGTSPVGVYPANGYGLYDMIGNVWEWTSDWYTGHRSARMLHGPGSGRRRGPQRRPAGSGPHPAQGHEGRLAPVRAELLPPLPARRAHGPARRHLHQPPRAPARPAHARTCLTAPHT
jgi:formylglycine-generating enzyme required for sulfatase activity